MKNPFNSVKMRSYPRSMFDMSYSNIFTTNLGTLTPIFVKPVLPGDTWNNTSEVFVRFSPMLAPVMSNIDIYTHFFFVPHRLNFPGWEKFLSHDVRDVNIPEHVPSFDLTEMTGSTTAQNARFICDTYFQENSLADYLGFPNIDYDGLSNKSAGTDVSLSLLPLLAYARIYDEWYRNPQLEAGFIENLVKDLEDIGSSINVGRWWRNVADDWGVNHTYMDYLLHLRNKGWEKDYFTSALPFPQNGPDVVLPLNGSAPVGQSGPLDQSYDNKVLGVDSQDLAIGTWNDSTGYFTGDTQAELKLAADLRNATGSTVEELRMSLRLQRFFEKMAVAGNRYIEHLLTFWGVRSSNKTLQRSQYLGGGKSPILISEVLQQSQSTAQSAQGNMAGHGIGVLRSHSFKHTFEEHGYIMGIMSVVPRSSYCEGIPRELLKKDPLEFGYPDFAGLGEQEVKDVELYCRNGSAFDSVFGYQQRYAEYKYSPSEVHGDFKHNLAYWHCGRLFENQPQLNADFVHINPAESGLNRIFNVVDNTEQHLYVQVYNNTRAVRELPFYSTPGLL